MTIYYRECGLTWEQYLRQEFVADANTAAFRNTNIITDDQVDYQIRYCVASREALQRKLVKDNHAVTNRLNQFEDGISKLGANYNWTMSKLLHKLNIQNMLADDNFQELPISDNEEHRRGYVNRGYSCYKEELYQKALENLLKAEQLKKDEPFVLYTIGQIYLYESNLVDLEKAQDYFLRAARYYIANKKSKLGSLSFFHAGIAAYLRADDTTAPQLSQIAGELNPAFAETFYNNAKFFAAQGLSSGLTNLEIAIRMDRNYALKMSADPDFTKISDHVQNLMEKLRKDARCHAEKFLTKFEQQLDEFIIFNKEAKKQVAYLLNWAKTTFALDTYFDYLDSMSIIKTALEYILTLCENHIYIKNIQSLSGHTRVVRSVAFSPDSKLMASGAGDKTIKLWNVATGEEIATLSGHNKSILSVAFSPNGKILASGSEDKKIILWEIATRKSIGTITGHRSYVTSIAFSPDGKLLASGSADNSIKLWEVISRKKIRTPIRHVDLVKSIAFSPDGKILASGAADNSIKIRNLRFGIKIRTFAGHTDSVNDITFSPNNEILASGSDDGTIKLWNVASGACIHTINGKKGAVHALCFSPFGNILISSYSDKTVKLWDILAAKELRPLNSQITAMNCIAVSPDGTVVAGGAEENQIKLWTLECNILTKTAISDIEKKLKEKTQQLEQEKKRKVEEELILRQKQRWHLDKKCEECGAKLSFWEKLVKRGRCKKHKKNNA